VASIGIATDGFMLVSVGWIGPKWTMVMYGGWSVPKIHRGNPR
jgi:hypothetical protein